MSEFDPVVGLESNTGLVHVPTSLQETAPELYEFLSDLLRDVREQNDLTIYGSSKLPWVELTRYSTERIWQLGSLARFFHPVYGLIHARYIRLNRKLLADGFGFPVGREISSKTWWSATDVYADSHGCLGVCFSNAPVGLSYGWAVVQGIAIAPLHVSGSSSLTKYAWVADRTLGDSALGPTVVSRLSQTNTDLGTLQITDCEMSDSRVASLARSALAAEIDSIVSLLATSLTHSNALSGLDALVTELQLGLGQLNLATVSTSRGLDRRVVALESVIAALGSGGGVDLTAITAQVDGLLARVTELESTRPPATLATDVSNLDSRLVIAESNIQSLLTSVAALVSAPAGGGGSAFSMTQIEVDFGWPARRSGGFQITGSGFVVGKPVLIQQAGGALTGKGPGIDESEFDQITVTGLVVSATVIQCYWNANGFVGGNFKFNYTVGA